MIKHVLKYQIRIKKKKLRVHMRFLILQDVLDFFNHAHYDALENTTLLILNTISTHKLMVYK